jgi:hypothetical protein
MPLIRLETSARLADEAKARLAAQLSGLGAELLGKPEQYVMVVVADGLAMLHAGAPGPAAFLDVRSIGGLGGRTNAALAERLCQAVTAATGVPGDRTYLNFTSLRASDWGHDGGTFG